MRIYTWFLSFISILCVVSLKSFAQEDLDPKELFIEAESYFLFEEYKDALPLYQKILRVEPDNYNVYYKIGICYLNDIYLSSKSIKYLEQASQNITMDYRQNNYREKRAPLEAHYYLGKAYHINNMLDKAIESYQRFKNMANAEEYDLHVVEEDIRACQLAKKMMSDPVFVSTENVKDPVNTRFEELNPVISGDGNTMIFTRKLPFYTGVFIIRKNKDGTWSEPENLTPYFGLDGDSYSSGISYFGDEIFVYRSDNYDGNIYSSRLTDGKWGPLEKLNDNINTKFWESHASLSDDGQYLYFTSNRTGGYGGLDIYKSKRGLKGDWGPAVNLGPVINSPSNEETPFLSNEGYTLFFSSQGHQTMGGYDVFLSHLKSDGNWSKPVNMGSPLNTTNDNLFYNPMGVNSFGYMACYIEDNTNGMLDIYEIEVYNDLIPRTFQIKGQLSANETDSKFYRKVSVTLIDANTGEIKEKTRAEEDGSFDLSATQGDYILLIEGSEIEPYRKELTISVNHPEALLALPAISLEKSSVTTAPVAMNIKPGLEVKSDFYAVNDSGAVPIELIVPKGSDLEVIVRVNDSLVLTESIESVRKRFTYFYRPKPGENILKFTATDENGETSTAMVNVTYYPPLLVENQDKPEEIDAGGSVYVKSFDAISDGALQHYLSRINRNDFESFSALYSHLIEVSSQEGFSADDVNHLYAIYFSQKDKDLFNEAFRDVYPEQDSNWNVLLDSSAIPLIYIRTLLDENLISQIRMRESLLGLIYSELEDGNKLYSYLRGFHKDTAHSVESPDISEPEQAWELFSGDLGDVEAGNLLQIASTTEDLDFLFQNILIASSNGLKEYLGELQFEAVSIENSVDLLNHLFALASTEDYTYTELIEALEKASLNRDYYLDSFNELLTNTAAGTLKSQLLLLNLDENQIHTFEQLLEYLVDQSRHKNYSREELYNLLLDLTGITDVREFYEKLISYNFESINKALTDTSLKFFSNPYELLQYLLVATQDYDFTESDINNLLIRMILERGLSDRVITEYESNGGSIWKNKKFLTTIVLVNIVILILIILVTLRRKKQ